MSRSEALPSDFKRKRDEGNVSDTIFRRTKKGKKKGKQAAPQQPAPILAKPEDIVTIAPFYHNRQPDSEEPIATAVTLTRMDKSALQLSEDLLSVTGHKGYRSIRATHGVHQGAWYCEISVTHLGSTGHCRLGWCTKKAELQAPVGFDKFGYSYRDLEGSKYHKALREPYGSEYGEGDVIGMFIYMPASDKNVHEQEKELCRYKGGLYYKDEPDPEPEPLPGSVIAFTKNGEPQGAAFKDILHGVYFPAAALYTLPEQTKGATVTFNFGPDFKHSPPTVEECPAAKPFCEVLQLRALQQQATAAGQNLQQPTTAPVGEQLAAQIPQPMSVADEDQRQQAVDGTGMQQAQDEINE